VIELEEMEGMPTVTFVFMDILAPQALVRVTSIISSPVPVWFTVISGVPCPLIISSFPFWISQLIVTSLGGLFR
jgi:hypothetical protein